MAQVIQRIWNYYGIKCVLIGGPEEQGLRDQISGLCSAESLVVRPTKSLADLGAVIGSSLFFLGNDSGLMHVSTSLKRPVIAFFGPTDEGRTGPWCAPGIAKLILRNESYSCGPCWTLKSLGENKPCPIGNYPCLTELDIEQVWDKIQLFLDQLAYQPESN
jgi:heptosyltransferase II